MSLFLRLSRISLGQYSQKCVVKSGGFGKNIKGEDGHIRGFPIEGGSNLHIMEIYFPTF